MSRTRFWPILIGAMLVVLLGLTFACGGDDDDSGDDGDETPAASATDTNGSGDGEEVTLDVVMGDNFFEPAEFSVPAGAEVRFNLVNEGTAIHNMRIAGEDGDYNTDDDAVSDPDLVSSGETAVLEWTAPDAAGEFDFQCDLHPTDMLGTITVE